MSKRKKYTYETVPVYLITIPFPYIKRCYCCDRAYGMGFYKRSFIQIGEKRIRLSTRRWWRYPVGAMNREIISIKDFKRAVTALKK